MRATVSVWGCALVCVHQLQLLQGLIALVLGAAATLPAWPQRMRKGVVHPAAKLFSVWRTPRSTVTCSQSRLSGPACYTHVRLTRLHAADDPWRSLVLELLQAAKGKGVKRSDIFAAASAKDMSLTDSTYTRTVTKALKLFCESKAGGWTLKAPA